MSDTRPQSLGHDALGIVLFVLASLCGVSAGLSLLRPVEDPGEWTAMMSGLIGVLGPIPTLALSAGLAWAGARLWLFGISEGIGRDLAGLFGAAIGLAVLLGGLSGGAGGSLGAATGGAVAAHSTFAAVLLGLACLAAPIWLAWIRPREGARPIPRKEEQPPAPVPAESARAPAAGEARRGRPPEKSPVEEAETPEASPSTSQRPILPPLYPPDVRLEGRIPEGARPLAPPDARPPFQPRPQGPRAPEAPTLPGEPGPGHVAPRQPPGADLAADQPAPAGALSTPAAPRPAQETEPAGGLGPRAAPSDTPPEAGAPAEPEAGAPPAPSWEQSSLFDEEPVDAYGTPLSLVDRLREANRETARRRGEDPPGADPEGDAPAEGPEEHRGAGAEDPAAPEVEEPPWEDPEGDRGALEGARAAAAEEPESQGGEETPRSEGAGDGDHPVDQTLEEDELRAEDASPRELPAAQAAEPGEAEVAEGEPEREIRPAPRARPAKPAAGAKHAPPSEGDELVFKAGCLILERQRVAVSMLQREFALGFDEATAVLDRLQEAGLIGPYLGGQRRDILLTPEEWRERVGA